MTFAELARLFAEEGDFSLVEHPEGFLEITLTIDGVMGVPITFLGKWNPDQFEITGFYYGDDGQFLRLADYTPYRRILIRRINQFDKV